MQVRKYGNPPFKVALLHGGPGAPGYMAPIARKLSDKIGILEPIQSEDSLVGQIDELKEQLQQNSTLPVTLVGSSWGAVLALFLAARESSMVKKLILIGSAVFDSKHSAMIENIRFQRLSPENQARYKSIKKNFQSAPKEQQNSIFKEWGKLFMETDLYDPITTDLEVIEVQAELHKKVWGDFVTLRNKPGYLKNLFSRIKVPVIVIHGDYDPHPIEGIRPFLESCLADPKFIIIPDCGHYPWIEKKAADYFYSILIDETR